MISSVSISKARGLIEMNLSKKPAKFICKLASEGSQFVREPESKMNIIYVETSNLIYLLGRLNYSLISG